MLGWRWEAPTWVRPGASGALLLCGAALPAQGQAQPSPCRVQVRVVAERTDSALANVVVGRTTASDETRTDANGLATLPAPGRTAIGIVIRRLGYAPVRAAIVPMCDGEAGTPERIALQPMQALPPVLVRANAVPRQASGPLAGFYERRARAAGSFFTHAEIMRRNATSLTQLLRVVPGWDGSGGTSRPEVVATMGVSRTGTATPRMTLQRCYPTLIIDGATPSRIGEISTDAIDARSLAGVEVYTDQSRTPSEFLSFTGANRCGTVAIWSRRYDVVLAQDSAGQAPVLRDTVYAAHEVDVVAVLDTARSVPPLYPARLKRREPRGEVRVELVVLASGAVHAPSATVLHATDPAFADAVVDGLPLMRFVPARRLEHPVAQRVALEIKFGPP